MPRRELREPHQVIDWLKEWGDVLKHHGTLILIGSGGLVWHVNLMPRTVLRELPSGWETRASRKTYGRLTVIVPAPADLLAPKMKRGEPRDLKHAEWARNVGLVP